MAEIRKKAIEIVGANVYFVDKSIEKIMTISDFMESISTESEIDSGWIPKNCRRIYKKGPWKFCLFEFSPNKQINARIYSKNKELDPISVILPPTWHYLLFTVMESPNGSIMGEVFFIATQNRLQSADQTVYHPLLPNIYENGRICLGTQTLKATDPSDKMEEILAILFNGDWNYDLIYEMSHPLSERYSIHLRVLEAQSADAEATYRRARSEKTKEAAKIDFNAARGRYLEAQLDSSRIKWYYKTAEEEFDKSVQEKDPSIFMCLLSNLGSYESWLTKITSNPRGG